MAASSAEMFGSIVHFLPICRRREKQSLLLLRASPHGCVIGGDVRQHSSLFRCVEKRVLRNLGSIGSCRASRPSPSRRTSTTSQNKIPRAERRHPLHEHREGAVLDEFRDRPKEASAIDLDAKVVAARCKLTGMHWRHANAAGVALLRATLGSNFKIVA